MIFGVAVHPSHEELFTRGITYNSVYQTDTQNMVLMHCKCR